MVLHQQVQDLSMEEESSISIKCKHIFWMLMLQQCTIFLARTEHTVVFIDFARAYGNAGEYFHIGPLVFCQLNTMPNKSTQTSKNVSDKRTLKSTFTLEKNHAGSIIH